VWLPVAGTARGLAHRAPAPGVRCVGDGPSVGDDPHDDMACPQWQDPQCPPAHCPAHLLTDVSVWVSSPVPAPVSSTYSQ